jgi:hypothetical protein
MDGTLGERLFPLVEARVPYGAPPAVRVYFLELCRIIT